MHVDFDSMGVGNVLRAGALPADHQKHSDLSRRIDDANGFCGRNFFRAPIVGRARKSQWHGNSSLSLGLRWRSLTMPSANLRRN